MLKDYADTVNISIHALLAESDKRKADNAEGLPYFYPRSPCGERLTLIQKLAHLCLISIHALLAESDTLILGDEYYGEYFYPRSPCGERHS